MRTRYRNALVRANYNGLKSGIHETTEYLELFLRNLLLGEHNPLHNRTMHISGVFKETEKPDIEGRKADIGVEKLDIEGRKADIQGEFSTKTTEHIVRLREEFQNQAIFGRSDVMRVLGIKTSRASELLKAMVEHGTIEPVSGLGKGRYRFKQR